MFAWNYEDDFLAGYDHGKQAGTMHVADHHMVPGQEVLRPGATGPRGRMWDNILTDNDGPYLELMVGRLLGQPARLQLAAAVRGQGRPRRPGIRSASIGGVQERERATRR